MGAFEDFLKRQGYVKLDQYGLVLTADDRILSTRPAVLDDGLGGKIVGWTDGDLAAAELEHWGAPKKKPAAATPARPVAAPPVPTQRPLPGVAAMPAVASAPVAARAAAPVAVAMDVTSPIAAPVAAPVAVSAPVAAPVVRASAPAIAPPVMSAPPPPVVSELALAPTVRQPVFGAGSAPTKAPQVAAEPPVEEDEWEWEIAMARARAAADDVQEAAASITSGFTAPRAPKAPKVAPAKAAPAKAAPSKMLEAKTDPMVSWPATEELKPGWNDVTGEAPSPQVLSPQHKQLLVAKSTAAPRATVIPVPALPVAVKPTDVRPVVTPSRPVVAPSRARMPRGTGREDTVQTLAAPANDDHTSPYVTLPSEVKPTGHAGTRRVAAKHR